VSGNFAIGLNMSEMKEK